MSAGHVFLIAGEFIPRGVRDNMATDLPLIGAAFDETIINPRLFGAHTPTSGGLHNALLTGKAMGCSAVQIFTKSPKQWFGSAPSPEAIEKFKTVREETGIEFVCSHDSYLINLAAPAEEVMEKSLRAFSAELDYANSLDLSWVVTHMGAHLKQGEDAAYDRLIASLNSILEATDKAGQTVGIALETTAGQGTGLGWQFEQIARVLEGVNHHPRVGVCLDTCHIFVAGYDLRDPEAYEATISQFDNTIGLANLKIIHANDAKKPLGSRVDRHEHIGDGEIGAEAFTRLVNDPRLIHLPFIVETPDSEEMHPVNVKRLHDYVIGDR
jgi:deoxyribonuclease IV